MPSSLGNLIIIGASARAAAQSAIRAGYAPWCIDLFADRDLKAIAPVKRCPREAWPHGVLELRQDAPQGPVLFTGKMEDHLEVIQAIAQSRALLTGPVPAMVKLREPLAYKNGLDAARIRTRTDGENTQGSLDEGEWPMPSAITAAPSWIRRALWKLGIARRPRDMLVKPRRGGDIQHYRPGAPIDFNEAHLQEFIPGTPISAVYHASASGTSLFGVSEQLIGDPAFGGGPFQYAGSIAPYKHVHHVWNKMSLLGTALADWSGYRGLFGVDAVHGPALDAVRRDGERSVYPIEVNPRYTASIETLEAMTGRSALTFSIQRQDNEPPPVLGGMFHGKAIVYARTRCRISEIDVKPIADVPARGETIEQGHPICTVFARGGTRDECLAHLRDLAAQVYTRLRKR